jgi:hypothetical protein
LSACAPAVAAHVQCHLMVPTHLANFCTDGRATSVPMTLPVGSLQAMEQHSSAVPQ